MAEAQSSVVDAIKLDKDGTFNEKQLLNGDGAKTQLGWVGGRIVAEVFYGLLDSDSESYFNAAPEYWEPILGGNEGSSYRFAGDLGGALALSPSLFV